MKKEIEKILSDNSNLDGSIEPTSYDDINIKILSLFEAKLNECKDEIWNRIYDYANNVLPSDAKLYTHFAIEIIKNKLKE